MKIHFKLLNNLLGWFMFLIASVTYLLTIEPTASWWDCGEYIATAFKLQVGHPPGAPTVPAARPLLLAVCLRRHLPWSP